MTTRRRDERGQIVPVVAAVVAAIALAGATLTAMVWASDAKRSRAIEEKAAREEFNAPPILIAGLAASGPERQCALDVLARHGVTGEDPTWRAEAVPLPASTGDRAEDRRLLDEWKSRMRAYIRSFQSEIDNCWPTRPSVPSDEQPIEGFYEVTSQILEARETHSTKCVARAGTIGVSISTVTGERRLTLALGDGRSATGALSDRDDFSMSMTIGNGGTTSIQGHFSASEIPIGIEFTESLSIPTEEGDFLCRIRATGIRLEN